MRSIKILFPFRRVFHDKERKWVISTYGRLTITLERKLRGKTEEKLNKKKQTKDDGTGCGFKCINVRIAINRFLVQTGWTGLV